MAAKLIKPNEAIEVTNICALLYGQPGSRKSSTAQTAENPVTFAFDPGIYRAYGRKDAVLFETWADVVAFDVGAYSTIVVDTAGMALDKLAVAIIDADAKDGNRLGGLSLKGYGKLKTQFAGWVSAMKQRGKDIVFIAHEKEDGAGEEIYSRPDIAGGSYATLMNHCDIVGYMHFGNGKRVIDFNPTDRWMAKTPPCSWPQIVLPDFSEKPNFLAKLIAEAKASMGQISAAGAEIAKVLDEWTAKLASDPSLDELNAMLPEVKKPESKSVQNQIWHIVSAHAERCGLVFDGKKKVFTKKEAA